MSLSLAVLPCVLNFPFKKALQLNWIFTERFFFPEQHLNKIFLRFFTA